MSSVDDLKKIITAINPDKYYDIGNADSYEKLNKFKKIIEKEGVINGLKTAEKERLLSSKSLSSYKLVFDSDSNQLEPIYYWIVDFMQGNLGIKKVEKVVDNYMSSPGSGHFADMQQRESRLRQEAMNTMGAINQVIKSVIQLLYDLKEFEQRLEIYDKAKEKDRAVAQGARMNLKQVWLDNVDMKKGNTSVKALAFSQAAYATLIDAFMIVNDEKLKDENGNEIDLNERVKRLLQQRIQEFNIWVGISESELRKRFNIQKAYLKSQVETVKLYTKWAMPYIKAAKQLEMKGFDKDPSLVNAFSTTMFELVVMGKIRAPGPDEKKFKDYKMKRDYTPILLVSFNYRGKLAQKVTQRGDYSYGYGGKAEISFDAYVLNSEEMKLMEKFWNDAQVDASLEFIKENTEVSLAELKEELNHFLEDKTVDKKKEDKKKEEDDTNPFTALWNLFKLDFGTAKKEKKEIKDAKDIEKDNFVEKDVRINAENTANKLLFTIYDVYKKAHIMASSPEPFDNGPEKKNDKPLSLKEFLETKKG